MTVDEEVIALHHIQYCFGSLYNEILRRHYSLLIAVMRKNILLVVIANIFLLSSSTQNNVTSEDCRPETDMVFVKNTANTFVLSGSKISEPHGGIKKSGRIEKGIAYTSVGAIRNFDLQHSVMIEI